MCIPRCLKQLCLVISTVISYIFSLLAKVCNCLCVQRSKDLPWITIVIEEDEWHSQSVQRLVDESIPAYDCHCQSEPKVCLKIKSQDVNKFIKALKLAHEEAKFGKILINKEEYDALRYFHKNFFTSNFTKEREAITTSVGVFLLPKTAELALKLKSLRNSLRKEDIILSSNEFETFTSFPENSSTDLDVLMVPKNEERKVTLYAMNYDAMTKAKHLVSVRSGKIKPTMREPRKFDPKSRASDSGDSEQSSVSDAQSVRLPSKTSSSGEIDDKGDKIPQPASSIPLDLVTDSGIHVSVYKADITQLTVDAIVNAANDKLQHGGGVAAVIAKAAGADLELEGDDYVKLNGPLSVTQVVPTTAGILPCKKVLHAVGPCWFDYQDKDTCQLHLEQTVFNSLKTAHDLKLSSIAVSSISSAIFGVPKQLCAKMYLAAVQRFDKNHGNDSSLRHVHFVDINDEMVGLIQDTFTDNWSSVITPPST